MLCRSGVSFSRLILNSRSLINSFKPSIVRSQTNCLRSKSFSSLSNSFATRRICLSSTVQNHSSNKSLFSGEVSPISSFSQVGPQRCSFATQSTLEDDRVFEITPINLREAVEGKEPTIVYCTADWCGPCKQLRPKIEGDIRKIPGVKFGTLDVDKEQQLAGSLRIQSIPAVFAFQKGKLLSSFVGVPPEKQYQEFLQAIKGGQSSGNMEQVLEEAEQKLLSGEMEDAAMLFSQVVESHDKENDPFGARSTAGLIQCLLHQGNKAAANQLVSNLKSRYEKCLDLPSVKSAILSCELGDLDVSSDRREELEKIVSGDPTKLQEKFELSQIYVSLNRHDDALEHLIEIIKKDKHWNEDAAKEYLLKMFDSLGRSHPLAISGRRRLTSLWF